MPPKRKSICTQEYEGVLITADYAEPCNPPVSTLNNVVAYVEYYSNGFQDRTKGNIAELLVSLGAQVVPRWSVKVTHCIFSEGRKSIYQKCKEADIPMVSGVWVYQTVLYFF